MIALPEPDWIALSESARRARRAFDAEPPEIEAALIAAFHDGKIRTRGRSSTYFRHDYLVDLAKSIWDQAGVGWEADKFDIPAHTPGRKFHDFTDVVVYREDLEEWFTSAAAGQSKSTKVKSSKGSSQPGRKPGSGSYAKDDKPLVEKMKNLISDGNAASVHAAAMQVVGCAKGGGQEASKVRRLIDRYNDELNSINSNKLHLTLKT
jgi:hypothetical protein